MGEYFISLKEGDSNDAILGWQNSRPIYNITTTTIPSICKNQPTISITKKCPPHGTNLMIDNHILQQNGKMLCFF